MSLQKLSDTLGKLFRALAQAVIVLALFLAVAVTALLVAVARALPYAFVAAAFVAYVGGGVLAFASWAEIYGGGLDAISVSLAYVLLGALIPFWTFANSQKLAEIFGAVLLAVVVFAVQFGIGRFVTEHALHVFAGVGPTAGLVLVTFLILCGGQNENERGG